MNVKGSALKARVEWARRRGEEDLAAWQAALSEDTRTLVRQGVMVNRWYPFSTFIEMNETLDRMFGRGDLQLCYELGRFGCDLNLPTIYKVLFSVMSVNTIIRRAAAAWRVNYDAGEMKVVEQTEGFVRLQVTGVPSPHRAHCLSVVGWIVRACELSGGEVVDMMETCRALGEPACQFDLSWRAR